MIDLIFWPLCLVALLVAVEVEKAVECEQDCTEQVDIEDGREK